MPSRHLNIFLFVLLLLATAVYYLDAIAQVNFFYWTFWWYDIMMHFLGGLVVSGVVLWTVVRFTTLSGAHTRYLLYISLISALVIGIGWEFFEYLNGMYVGQANIVTDTAIDLVMDTLGAVVSWVGVRFLLTRRITRI